MSRKTRLDDIDSAKGLAIVLVVLGHLAGSEEGNPPKDFDWYMTIFYAIYGSTCRSSCFLSGFVFFYTYNPIRTLQDYRPTWCASFGVSGRRTCCLAG